MGRFSVHLAIGVGVGVSWGIERQYLANNVAVFIFVSAELPILGVVNKLSSYIGHYLE